MQPEIVAAAERLEREGRLSAPAASRILRVARGELLSVRIELRTILYAGVTLIAAGTGLFVKEHYRQIGPVAMTALLSLAAAAGFAYVVRRAPEFSWEKVPPPTLAFDYVLLLAVLLLGSDLAYMEAQFRVLGPEWKYHLLFYSVVALVLAYRFDSMLVLSLALTSFAAWRGVAAKTAVTFVFSDPTSRLRANALFCGALFAAGAIAAVRWRRKPHFEPVWGNLGVLLLLGALLSGALGPGNWMVWQAPLLLASAAAVAVGLRAGRELYLAEGVLAGYAGALRIVLHPLRGDTEVLSVITFSAIGVLILLLSLHRIVRRGRAA